MKTKQLITISAIVGAVIFGLVLLPFLLHGVAAYWFFIKSLVSTLWGVQGDDAGMATFFVVCLILPVMTVLAAVGLCGVLGVL